MKIKDILRGLIESGEDFSDHAVDSLEFGHPENKRTPMCDKGCTFCDAWRSALWLIRLEAPNLAEFEAGDKVFLSGGVKGRVIATDFTVRVEVQGPAGHGPYATGSFRPGDLKIGEAPEFTYWLDTKGGDIWERRESNHLMRIVRWSDLHGQSVCEPMSWEKARRTFEGVEEWYGPLTQVEKP